MKSNPPFKDVTERFGNLFYWFQVPTIITPIIQFLPRRKNHLRQQILISNATYKDLMILFFSNANYKDLMVLFQHKNGEKITCTVFTIPNILCITIKTYSQPALISSLSKLKSYPFLRNS